MTSCLVCCVSLSVCMCQLSLLSQTPDPNLHQHTSVDCSVFNHALSSISLCYDRLVSVFIHRAFCSYTLSKTLIAIQDRFITNIAIGLTRLYGLGLLVLTTTSVYAEALSAGYDARRPRLHLVSAQKIHCQCRNTKYSTCGSASVSGGVPSPHISLLYYGLMCHCRLFNAAQPIRKLFFSNCPY